MPGGVAGDVFEEMMGRLEQLQSRLTAKDRELASLTTRGAFLERGEQGCNPECSSCIYQEPSHLHLPGGFAYHNLGTLPPPDLAQAKQEAANVRDELQRETLRTSLQEQALEKCKDEMQGMQESGKRGGAAPARRLSNHAHSLCLSGLAAELHRNSRRHGH